MLVRLMYASRAVPAVDQEELVAILKQSKANNPKLGVTGVLCACFDSRVFMQVLEGGRTAVNLLYNDIVRDTRHKNVVVLHYEEAAQRRFANWTMGQVNLAKVNPSVLLKYSETTTLDPYAMSGSAAMALLEELIATAQIVGRAA